MKKFVLITLVFLMILSLSINSFAATDSTQRQIKTNIKLFEFNYTNYAWGYHNQGWYINSAGEIITYEEVNGEIIEETYGKVPLRILYSNYILLLACVDGELTKPVPVGADMGILTYKGYLFDGKEIILNVSGDYSQYNTAPEAKSIYVWLQSINEQILNQ